MLHFHAPEGWSDWLWRTTTQRHFLFRKVDRVLGRRLLLAWRGNDDFRLHIHDSITERFTEPRPIFEEVGPITVFVDLSMKLAGELLKLRLDFEQSVLGR